MVAKIEAKRIGNDGTNANIGQRSYYVDGGRFAEDDSADAVRCIAGELDERLNCGFQEVTMEDDSNIFIVVSEGKRVCR
jgi:hypothetical protein